MALSNDPINHPHGVIVPAYGAGGTPSSRRRPNDPAKLGLHTTETQPGTGRIVARQLKSAYTALVEIRAREVLQCLPMNWTAHSLKGGTGGYETNHSGRMHPQFAIVGYAKDIQWLTRDDLDWLADVVLGPAMALCGVPNVWRAFYGPNDGIGPPWLATEESPVRMQGAEFHAFSGVYGHQHAPFNDHWDPGKLDWQYLRGRLTPPTPAPPPVVASPAPETVTVDIALLDRLERSAAATLALTREARAT